MIFTNDQRNAIIEDLVTMELETNAGDGDWFLRGLLRDGFSGYKNMSNEELNEVARSSGVDVDFILREVN
jgi:hypothetical protein